MSGLVFCVGCSEAEHIVGCPVAAVMDIRCSGEEDLVAISDDEGLQESSLHPEDMVDEQLDLAAVVGDMASCGDQMLYGEDDSRDSNKKQHEGEPVEAVIETAVVKDPAAGTVEPVEVPVKVVVVPVEPNFQFQSAAPVAVSLPQQSVCPTQDDVITKSQQHVSGSVRTKHKMTQPRDVTDLPQEDASCFAPPTADDIYAQELMKTIEAMNRDMPWLREGSDLGPWGFLPGNMDVEEGCLGFF